MVITYLLFLQRIPLYKSKTTEQAVASRESLKRILENLRKNARIFFFFNKKLKAKEED